MSNDVVNYNPGRASLLEMRSRPDAFPRINAMPLEEAVAGMERIVTQAFLYRGQASDPENVRFIAATVTAELLDDDTWHSGNISLGEIQVVVKRAVLGGSEMFGVSVASLYKVITDYARGEGHHLQKEADKMRRSATAPGPIVTAYAGAMIRNNKLNKNKR